ncbi:DNA-binding protein [Mycobacterium lentiflavum]|uniref:DNA-binding protein n=1 Tax=Mycobacterium lentiflavum TaxID=141349 RepID=A0A0E4GYA2_MYCLN|nr:helix-turn-helix transcriptional regulator [Mycobacterium lentiflavum]CQD14999.1 DNA-binding protein [Mycobacterium lentiflavum]
MDKQELGHFLRSRRERLRPSDVGLEAAARRRTPGLRREEVAVLAHISTEYYTRLEQGRAPRPSGEVLAGIAQALLLTEPEITHMHDLAGTSRKPTAIHDRTVRPSMVALISRLPSTVGVLLSAAFEILAWNDLATALVGDLVDTQPAERNLARHAFLPNTAQSRRPAVSDMADFQHHIVTQLRSAAARYPNDAEIRDLIADLRANSDDFARLWHRYDIRPQPIITKTFHHPEVGSITVDCDTLLLPDRDQQLVLFTAQPGSRDAESLELLRVISSGQVNSP